MSTDTPARLPLAVAATASASVAESGPAEAPAARIERLEREVEALRGRLTAIESELTVLKGDSAGEEAALPEGAAAEIDATLRGLFADSMW